MAHKITEFDSGYVTGGKTWHERPEYRVVESVGIADAIRCVDFPVKKLPTYLSWEYGGAETGGFCIARMDTLIPTVLAPNIGDRYEILDRRELLNTFDEYLLAVFPQLKIAGCGTLSQGRTFWIQFLAERYNVKGDTSDHELRLCYAETYGVTAHQIFCSHVRIVCDNTLRFAREDAMTRNMFTTCRHTPNAEQRINATSEMFAELHMGLEKDRQLLEYLAGSPADEAMVGKFLEKVLPKPKPAEGAEEPCTRALNRWTESTATVRHNFETGTETMDTATAYSCYGLLQAYTDYVDHDSYSRSAYDRWMDSQSGGRATAKAEAVEWLLANA